MDITTFVEWDKKLFLQLNALHHPWLDDAMALISHRLTWIPLYVFLIFVIIRKFKKQSYVLIPIIIVLITVSDQLSSSIIKPYFERLRPCHEPLLQAFIHLVNGCGGTYGFVSSHASNCFAISVLLMLVFKGNSPIRLLLPWAVLVAYSRIYMGVHYPGDVIGGAVLGSVLGVGGFLLFSKIRTFVF